MTRTLRLLLGAIGVVVMLVAAHGIWADRRYTAPTGLVEWLAGSIVLSDFVIAPLVLVLGFLVVRLVPAVVRPAVVLGLMVAGSVFLVGLPVLAASRRPRANPTVLPLDYGRGLLATFAAVVLVTAVGAGVLVRRSRRRPPRGASGTA